ncbi:hypothetical protein [Rhizobium leguminosarum]|uniref:hypothetical protein n=1 Tax=Rhizobium leguminosarum TaxID=384 RepID=UPI00037C2B8E|nr:hypothetical protein [Rhizobium leguminosarum]
MFKDKTVFVVGAGASAEFAMPVGSALMERIKRNSIYSIEYGRFKMVAEADLLFRHYTNMYNLDKKDDVDALNARLEVMRDLVASIDMAESIDEYIYRHSHNPLVSEIGKLQVAHAIARAESDCYLRPDDFNASEKFKALNNAWIYSFSKILMIGIRAEEIDRIGENITIICFNYDRCIEHYLEHAIVHAYPGTSIERARDIVNNINIIHPYGWLGSLKAFPFGRVQNFAAMADNLITWSESIRDPQVKERMGHAMSEAETIVFLGFAFARQNMDLLHATDKKWSNKAVFATGKGLEPEAEASYQENISLLYSPGLANGASERVRLQWDTECAPFMKKHRYNLSL